MEKWKKLLVLGNGEQNTLRRGIVGSRNTILMKYKSRTLAKKRNFLYFSNLLTVASSSTFIH